MALVSKPRNLSGSPSIFLDSLRIVSALTVFYVHAYAQWNSKSGSLESSPDLGHVAVVVFFVLSGYVIAHTTTRNNRGLLDYSVARLSRLYSVVLPALIVTALAEFIVWKIDPALDTLYTRGSSWPRYILSSLFLNEIWFHSSSPPINGPLWSLSYEFWYYVIFGCFFYRVKNTIKSYILPILVCVIAGPKILIMMPIWLAGNFAYRLQKPLLSTTLSWFLLIGLLLIIGILIYILPLLPFQLGSMPLSWSAQFFTDWIIGFFICTSLWLLPTEDASYSKSKKKRVKVFRKFADLTFPIYVLHKPLLVLWRACFGTLLYNHIQMFSAILGVLGICIFIGLVLEKYRYVWTNFFSFLFNNLRLTSKKFTEGLN